MTDSTRNVGLELHWHDPLLDNIGAGQDPRVREIVRQAVGWTSDRPEGDEMCPSCYRRTKDPLPDGPVCLCCYTRARDIVEGLTYGRQARAESQLRRLFNGG